MTSELKTAKTEKTENTNSDFESELQIGINKLMSLISEYKKKDKVEIEIRLGQIQHNGFKSGLGSKDFYNRIKNTLDSSKAWTKIINTKTEEYCESGLKRITSFNGKKVMKHQSIKKNKISTIDLQYYGTPYDIRLCVSTEIPVEDKINVKNSTLRKKNRYSYIYKDYQIDLTQVEQIYNGVSEINFELEVELNNLQNNVIDKYRAHSALLLIRDIINMCEKIESGCKIIEPDEVEIEED